MRAGSILRVWVCLWLAAGWLAAAESAPDYFSVHYPASAQAGGLAMEVTYHVWIPPSARKVRAVIVHQHGCGDGAEKAGETAALDLHWRALAARHHAALLSPHYEALGANCRLWCDPRAGSGATFIRALQDLAQHSGHPELATAPWCLWGHSGGGFWTSLMLEKHPERIVAAFCRSGTAANAWSKQEIPEPHYPEEAFRVPIILNPGLKERGDKQFDGAWTTSERFFAIFRPRGAPIAFVPDPLSSHECRNSRLMAIPFFDACLRLRLPKTGAVLKPIEMNKGFLTDWENGEFQTASTNDPARGWLPDLSSANAFAEYVKTGLKNDATPPRTAPAITRVKPVAEGIELAWEAEADFESGIRQFAIYRDGKLLTKYPETAASKSGYTQFQSISYHDTPVPNAPAMSFIDKAAVSGERHKYAIATVNGAGLEGPRSRAQRPAKHP